MGQLRKSSSTSVSGHRASRMQNENFTPHFKWQPVTTPLKLLQECYKSQHLQTLLDSKSLQWQGAPRNPTYSSPPAYPLPWREVSWPHKRRGVQITLWRCLWGVTALNFIGRSYSAPSLSISSTTQLVLRLLKTMGTVNLKAPSQPLGHAV